MRVRREYLNALRLRRGLIRWLMRDARHEMTEREEVIERAQAVVAARQACIDAGRSKESVAVVERTLNDLLDYVLLNFTGPVDHAQMRTMFAAGTPKLVPGGLDHVPNQLVPVAVMREILHTYRVQFNHRAVPGWRAFNERYSGFIIGA